VVHLIFRIPEKELVTELDKYKRSKKGPAIQAARLRNRSPNRFDQLIKNLEQERDYWKAEVERLQEVMTLVLSVCPMHAVIMLSRIYCSVLC